MRVSVSIEDYHADKTAISSSAFFYLSKCPAYYQLYKEGRFDKDASYFRIGSAVHTRILEPEKFEQDFVVMPKIDGRTTEGKKLKQEFEEKSEGKIVLGESEYDQVRRMADSVFKHKYAADLLTLGGEPEVSFFWDEQITEFPEGDSSTIGCHKCGHRTEKDPFQTTTECEVCSTVLHPRLVWSKTRPDYIASDTIIDVKTTKSIAGFQTSINTFLYDSQAAFQIAGAENEGYHITNYYWLVVEKEYPHLTAVFKASPSTLEQGRLRYQHLINVYKHALDTGDWYAYPDIIEI